MHQKTKEIETLIDFLTASGYLKKQAVGNSPRPCDPNRASRLTQPNKSLRTQRKKLSATANNGWKSGLFEHLRKLRRQLAEAQHVPPFVIFSDQALQDMWCSYRQMRWEFLEVKGVGHSKLEKYGTIFLDAIKEYKHDKQRE